MDYEVVAIVRDKDGMKVRIRPLSSAGWDSFQIPHPVDMALNPGDRLLIAVSKL